MENCESYVKCSVFLYIVLPIFKYYGSSKKLDSEIIKNDVLNELSETMPYQQRRRRSYDSVSQTIASLKLLKVDKELL